MELRRLGGKSIGLSDRLDLRVQGEDDIKDGSWVPGLSQWMDGCTTCCDREQVWGGAWETEVSIQSLMHFMEETLRQLSGETAGSWIIRSQREIQAKDINDSPIII